MNPPYPTYILEDDVAQKRDRFYGEQTIDETMADPIVHLMMRSDGVTPDEVWQLIRAVSEHLREQRGQLIKAA